MPRAITGSTLRALAENRSASLSSCNGTVGGGNSCRIRSKFTRLSFARTIALRGGEGRMQVSRMVGLVGGVGGKNGSSATPVWSMRPFNMIYDAEREPCRAPRDRWIAWGNAQLSLFRDFGFREICRFPIFSSPSILSYSTLKVDKRSSLFVPINFFFCSTISTRSRSFRISRVVFRTLSMNYYYWLFIQSV